jgi:cell cycle sensor histidine kinase DivJ
MDAFDSPIILICLAALASVVGYRELLRRRDIERQCNSLNLDYQSTVRLLRLTASDQRNVALALFGHAQTTEPPDAELAGLARRLLDMSEDLTQQTETPDATRRLQEEEVGLMSVIEFAMAQVAAHLGPGRRTWRLSSDLEQVKLMADRRAMNQVLVNVLSGAAAATRNGDWIELSCEADETSWSLIVQDEGIGLPLGPNESNRDESRGIGLRLTLARSLMQAHDGTLSVESAERVGTRVRLSFPVERLLDG